MQKLLEAKNLSVKADQQFQKKNYGEAAKIYSRISSMLSSLIDQPFAKHSIQQLKAKINKYNELRIRSQFMMKQTLQQPQKDSLDQLLLVEDGHHAQIKPPKTPNVPANKVKFEEKGQPNNIKLKPPLNNQKDKSHSAKKITPISNKGPKPAVNKIADKRHSANTPNPKLREYEKPWQKPGKKDTEPVVEPQIKDLIVKNIDVSFSDIVGLNDVKGVLEEAVIRPRKRPDLYQGIRAPPRGLLLYGPPGNGKTYICKALAKESGCTFIALSASSILNKYVGESQKMIKKVFLAAQKLAPTIIFIDQIDSMLTARSQNEHQASRRLKTQFLVLMDGINSPKSGQVMVIGATNLPKQLDQAAKRRFSKFVFIGHPDPQSRLQLVKRNLTEVEYSLSPKDMQYLIFKLEGYSASEIRNIVAETCMFPLREVRESKFDKITPQQLRKVKLDDFLKVLSQRKPIVSRQDLQKYKEKI